MKYVVCYFDSDVGKNRFKSFNHKNDALEFIETKRSNHLWAQLYVQATELPTTKVKCLVCRDEVVSLSDQGWCERCSNQMGDL